METLKIIESDIPNSSQLLISFVKTKVKGDKIIDPATLEQVKKTYGLANNDNRQKTEFE